MKIFGSISELVDLAFRLAGGKQVKLKSRTQDSSAASVTTVYIPNVSATGDQDIVLVKASQTLEAKELTSPDINGGTIDGAIIGGAIPAAGSFTDIVGTSLDINGAVEVNSLEVTSFSTAGVLHNDANGNISSSLLVNADVDDAAGIELSKLEAVSANQLLIGDEVGDIAAASLSSNSQLEFSYNAGEINAYVKNGAILDEDINADADIAPSKIKAADYGRPMVSGADGKLRVNAALDDDEVVVWNASTGDFASVDNVTSEQLGYLDGVGSNIQTQLDNKQAADATLTAIAGVSTEADKYIYFTGEDAAAAGTITAFGRSLLDDANGPAAQITLGLGSMATQSANGVQITGGNLSGVSLQGTDNGVRLGSGSASIASSTLTPAASKKLQLIASAADFGMIASPQDGQEYVLVNESASDIIIQNLTGATAANQIYTGTGSDFSFKAKSAVSVVYDGALSKWMLTGGGGGAGGLATEYVTAGGITAVKSTHYLTNLASSGQTITLPAGVDGDVIRFSDAGEVWDVYPLTIAPASGEKIDKLAIDETLVCDVKRGWVELSYNSSFGGWAFMSLASTSGSAAGSGEINAVLNSSAASDTTGWTGVTRVSSGSPLDPIVTTAFSISNAAAAESSTSGGYYSIASLAPGLKSRKLKVSFYFSTPATDVYRVSVYAGSTRLSLSSDSSGATTLPANVTGGYFEAYFDATTASAYSLNITRTSGTTGACVITQVIVGPGSNAQGAAISEWQSYTPTFSAGLGSVSTINFWYRRVGSDMEIQGSFYTGTVAGSVATFTLPSNLTVANTLVAVRSSLGEYYSQPSSVASVYGINSGIVIATALGANTLGFDYQIAASTSLFSPRNGATLFNNTVIVSLKARIPIAEWAGNGTVNLGGAAQVEYAYNTSASTTTGDTTSFGYGPSGYTFGSITAGLQRRVRFQYPIQNDDVITVEASEDRVKWFTVSGFCFNNSSADRLMEYAVYAGKTYGVGSISLVNSTDVDVTFGTYAVIDTASATYGANGTAWSAAWGARYWRVRKAKASAPVGFGKSSPANGFGLVAPRLGQQALTFSSTPTGWSLKQGVGIYYQDQNGNHRLKFNVIFTANAATSFTFTMDGVTFKNLGGGFQQAISAMCVGSAPYTGSAGVSSNSGTVNVYASTSSSDIRLSGDVELESKPTWA